MNVAIRNRLSDLPSSDVGDDGDDDEDELTEQGKLCEDDKPGWFMGRTNKTI
jgi:hypothetical protein